MRSFPGARASSFVRCEGQPGQPLGADQIHHKQSIHWCHSSCAAPTLQMCNRSIIIISTQHAALLSRYIHLPRRAYFSTFLESCAERSIMEAGCLRNTLHVLYLFDMSTFYTCSPRVCVPCTGAPFEPLAMSTPFARLFIASSVMPLSVPLKLRSLMPG
jgi:hypothetical protein